MANVRYAIQDWTRERGVRSGVPLYLYLVDHGLTDRFKADGDSVAHHITAAELDLWLTTLEDATGADNINVIIDACYSGSFIDKTPDGPATISSRNRVVIASTTSTLQAFGPPEGQGLYFSNAFFTALDNQQSLLVGFETGKQAVAAQKYPQLPWLDDNGDHSVDPTDGALAAGRALRRVALGGLSPSIEWVQGNASTRQIQARITDDSPTVTAWVEVFTPSYVPPRPDGSGTTRIVNVPVVHLTDPDGNGIYVGTFDFIEEGAYRLVAHARDSEGSLALPESGFARLGGNDVRQYLPLLLR